MNARVTTPDGVRVQPLFDTGTEAQRKYLHRRCVSLRICVAFLTAKSAQPTYTREIFTNHRIFRPQLDSGFEARD